MTALEIIGYVFLLLFLVSVVIFIYEANNAIEEEDTE